MAGSYWETLAILEYLADLFPEKGYGPLTLAHGRWRARSRPRCIQASAEVRYGWPMNLRRPKSHKPLDAEGDVQRARIETIWRECREKHGEGRSVPVRPFHRGGRHVRAGGDVFRHLWRRTGARHPRLSRRGAWHAGDANGTPRPPRSRGPNPSRTSRIDRRSSR